MHRIVLTLLCTGLLWACNQEPEVNVNSRYTVESVEIPPSAGARISRALLEDLQQQVGEKFNPELFESLARRIRNELRARTVFHKVARGSQPEHVKVTFEVVQKKVELGLSAPLLVYHSKEGWSAAVDGTARMGRNRFSMGVISDNDLLLERFAGLRGRFERAEAAGSRVNLHLDVESYHQQWNRDTLIAMEGVQEAAAGPASLPGIYRTRFHVQPAVTVALSRSLTLTSGLSFQQFQTQFPAAHNQASNAMIYTLRYHRRFEGTGIQQDLNAGYSLRAATRLLDSDFAYSRHVLGARYALEGERHTLILAFETGVLTGPAPLFDRLILGNSKTLRGWNKFEVAPLGGDRMASGSVEYRYRALRVFYDSGSVWDSGDEPIGRHSVGGGVRKGIFNLAVAFPLKDGRVDPVFIASMNF